MAADRLTKREECAVNRLRNELADRDEGVLQQVEGVLQPTQASEEGRLLHDEGRLRSGSSGEEGATPAQHHFAGKLSFNTNCRALSYHLSVAT